MHTPVLVKERSQAVRWRILLLGLLSAAVICIIISFGIGFYPIPISELLKAVFHPIFPALKAAPQTLTVVQKIRLPRILAAFLIGTALSISGSAYQGMFKNPLVSPDILGVSAGAGLGAAIAISGGFPYYMTQLFAFLGGCLVVGMTYFISSRVHYSQTLTLVLTGTVLQALCTSVITMLKYTADPNDTLPAITFWLMGSLAKVDMKGVLFSLPPIIVGLAIIFLMRWQLNLLSLNSEEAQSLGVKVKPIRLAIIFAATLLSAAAVCLGGIIGWVGLIIPHIVRSVAGSDYRKLLPLTALAGGIFLLLMDDLARSLMVMELPISVLTSFVGAPFFIMLILKRGKSKGAF